MRKSTLWMLLFLGSAGVWGIDDGQTGRLGGGEQSGAGASCKTGAGGMRFCSSREPIPCGGRCWMECCRI